MTAENTLQQKRGMQTLGDLRHSYAPSRDPEIKPLIRLENITKRFGVFTAVKDVSLDVFEGEFFSLLGPSGCGKTTLLRMLAGFETPDSGRILLAGENIAGLPPHQRPINMMFQSYALFPHLTVESNIAFGLKREGMAAARRTKRVEEMLALVKLEGLGARKPHQLSGGQRQRVALARALAKRPKVLLLDEPLAALDKKLREETQFELKQLQAELGLTFMIVTHDQAEAMTLSDRIGVMGRGHLAQVAPPREIYEQPATRYVAEFVGAINIFETQLESMDENGLTLACKETGTHLRDDDPRTDLTPGQRVFLAVRPEKMLLSRPGSSPSAENCLTGTVVDMAYLGDGTTYRVKLQTGKILRVAVANTRRFVENPPLRGDTVEITFRADAGAILTE